MFCYMMFLFYSLLAVITLSQSEKNKQKEARKINRRCYNVMEIIY